MPKGKKWTMPAMEQPKIGHLLEGGEHRDAIHIAVAPVVAGVTLSPGLHVTVSGNGTAFPSRAGGAVGIVDPYLTKAIKPGDRFYVFLFPGTITSLRHEWVHPSFPNDNSDAQKLTRALVGSEEWLRGFASRYKIDFDHMIMNAMRAGVISAGDDVYGLNDDEVALFWEHMEFYTGKKFDGRHRSNTDWRCSC